MWLIALFSGSIQAAAPPPPSGYTVGGVVKGLVGSVTLQNNGTNNLTVTADGPFTFTLPLIRGSRYNVTVLTQPAGQTCGVTNGSGTSTVNITSVVVACASTTPPTHTLSGIVSGLSGNSVVLQNNNTNDLVVSGSSFSFGSFAAGTAYAVTVKTHPSYPASSCTVSNGAGMIADADVVVQVSCTALPVPTLSANVDVLHAHAATLDWTAAPHAQSHNFYVSTARNCDFRGNFATCPGEKTIGVTPGVLAGSFNGQPLKNGQAYFFRVETVYDNGTKGLSNQDGARPNELAFQGAVKALTTAPNGTVYLGGNFSSVGVATGSGVPLDVSSGKFKTADFPIVAGEVTAVLADGANGWYIGGLFTHVGTIPRQNLAHIRADGSVDTGFNQFPNGPVQALELIGSTLYVGGSFTVVYPGDFSSAPARQNVAAISTLTGELLFWNPSPNAPVRALRVLGTALFVGGNFTTFNVGGGPAFLGQFPVSSSNGAPLSSSPTTFNMNLDQPVLALTASSNALYVGGLFTSFNGTARLHAAQLQLVAGVPTDVPAWHPDPGIGDAVAHVDAIAVSNSGNVYLGGLFTSIRGSGGSVIRRNLAAVSAATGALFPWAPNPNSVVGALALNGSALFVGGDFFRINGGGTSIVTRFNLASLDANPLDSGAATLNFHPDPKARVRALAVSNSTLFAGGQFTSLNGTDRAHLAAVDSQGALLPWNPTVNGDVNALAHFFHPSLGKQLVYVGGSFTTIGGQIHPNLAALDGNSGEVIPFFDDGSPGFKGTANGPVNALSVLESVGMLYVGGNFTELAGESTNPQGKLLRNLGKIFLFNGTIDLNFAPGPNDAVHSVAVVTDQNTGADVVYAGGDFMDIALRHSGTAARRHLVKVDADSGIALDDFIMTPDQSVSAIMVAPNFVVYVGGNFNQIGTVNGPVFISRLAAIDIDGTQVLTDFAPGPDGGEVLALAHYPSRVLAGGSFPNIGGQPASNFASLIGFTTLGVHTGDAVPNVPFPNGPVSAISLSPDHSKIYIGGTFTGIGGAARGSFGVLDSATGQLQ